MKKYAKKHCYTHCLWTCNTIAQRRTDLETPSKCTPFQPTACKLGHSVTSKKMPPKATHITTQESVKETINAVLKEWCQIITTGIEMSIMPKNLSCDTLSQHWPNRHDCSLLSRHSTPLRHHLPYRLQEVIEGIPTK